MHDHVRPGRDEHRHGDLFGRQQLLSQRRNFERRSNRKSGKRHHGSNFERESVDLRPVGDIHGHDDANTEWRYGYLYLRKHEPVQQCRVGRFGSITQRSVNQRRIGEVARAP